MFDRSENTPMQPRLSLPPWILAGFAAGAGALGLTGLAGCSSDAIGGGAAGFTAPSGTLSGLPGAPTGSAAGSPGTVEVSAQTPGTTGVIGTGPANPTALPSGSAAVGTSPLPSSTSPGTGGGRVYMAPAPAPPALPARTWRLTAEQYSRSVQALVGVVPDTSGFVPETDNGGVFPNFSDVGFVRLDQSNAYFSTAEAVAVALTSEQLGAIAGCELDQACADPFIAALTERAFRRAPTPEELSTYREIFDLGDASGDPLLGFRSVVKALLTAPHFLYRTEIGAADSETQNEFRLTDYEVASLLSFSVLSQPPSADLLAAAGRGELTTPEGLQAQLAELLTEPAAGEQLQRFLTQWLEVHHFEAVEKFEDTFPGFGSARESMWQETAGFLQTQGALSSTLATLLTADVTQDAELAGFYSSDASGGALGQRVGVLSLGTVLASHAKPYLSSPTLRGAFVRRRLLCQNLQLPGGDVPPLSATEALQEARSTRELYEQHASKPECVGCHLLMDNIGFAFENFDGAGRYRTLDTTQGYEAPVDPVSTLIDTDVNRPLTGPADLAGALAESELVRQCVSIQAFRFYFGQAESSLGLPPISAAHAGLRSGTFSDLLLGLLSSPSTTERVRQ